MLKVLRPVKRTVSKVTLKLPKVNIYTCRIHSILNIQYTNVWRVVIIYMASENQWMRLLLSQSLWENNKKEDGSSAVGMKSELWNRRKRRRQKKSVNTMIMMHRAVKWTTHYSMQSLIVFHSQLATGRPLRSLRLPCQHAAFIVSTAYVGYS